MDKKNTKNKRSMSLFDSVKKVVSFYGVSIKKYPKTFWATFLFYGLAAATSNVLIPLVYRRIIDVVTQGSADRAAFADPLFMAFMILVTFSIIAQSFFRFGDLAIVYTQSNIMKDISDRSFIALQKHSYSFFSDRFAGSLVAQTRRLDRAFENIHDTTVFGFWFILVNLIGAIVALTFVAPSIAIIFLIWFVFFLALTLFMAKKKLPFDMANAAEDSKVTGRLADFIGNIFTVKAFAGEKREISAFEDKTIQEERVRRRAWNFQNISILIQAAALSILELVAIYAVLRLWLAGSVGVGTIVLVQAYIAIIFRDMLSLGKSINKFTQGLGDAEEMIETLNKPIEISDSSHPQTAKINHGEIIFDRINFNYQNDTSVFNDFSLRIAAGEKVGLVGLSGSGKSTLTKLIMRFIDPQSGAVIIDGTNIKELGQEDLRRYIAYVPQDPSMFHRTLRENIAYSRDDATESDIIAASKDAHADDFIRKLPDQYETLVGERGIKLSGGERQRVAIARAILKNAPIIILDEATSSLDSESEAYVREGLDRLMQGRTALVIAHRLSTVRKLDRIIVLEDGKIVEEGKHDELIARGGRYAGFWNNQTGGFIEE